MIKRIEEFIVDKTLLKIGSELVWLWVAIEPANKEILPISISKERNMFVAERFLYRLSEKHGEHTFNRCGTWYPQACQFLKLRHHLHSPFEKSPT
jgi:putative transposase